jgi:hypothetical protein
LLKSEWRREAPPLTFLFFIAKKELASKNQNPRIEWRREAPPLDSWVLCPKQNLLCYIMRQ